MRQSSLLFLTLLGMTLGLSAATVTETASADSYITTHDGLGGVNATPGELTDLYSVSSGAAPWYYTFPLVRFDLSEYAGQQVAGDGALELTDLNTTGGTFQFDLYRVLVPWVESTVSWNSFGGFTPGTTVSSSPIASGTLTGGGVLSLVVSQSLIQSWIDSPGTNHGVLLVGTTWTSANGFSDRAFASTEYEIGAPSLTFDAAEVPEPSTMLLVGMGLAGAAFVQRRRA